MGNIQRGAVLFALLTTLAVSAAAQDLADPRDFDLPATAHELPAFRGERSKRFRLDGNRFAEVATGRRLHYRDTAGKWRAVDASFAAAGNDQLADRLPFEVGTTRQGLEISERGGSASVIFLTGNRPGLQARSITTRFPGQPFDWHWQLSKTELKLASSPIDSPQGASDYQIPYSLFGGFAPFALDDDGNLTSGSFSFGRPVLLGADGETYDGFAEWEVGATDSTLVLHVDDTELPPSAYPYEIDPPLTGHRHRRN